MFSKIKDALRVWLKVEPQVVYRVVEVKAPRLTQSWDKDTRDAVATLQAHPGWVAIQDRLSLQKQMLENKLAHEFHKDIRSIDYIQAGIFWLSYINEQIAKASERPANRAVDPLQEELNAFRAIDSQIERVGME
jgi:hypothetical protein